MKTNTIDEAKLRELLVWFVDDHIDLRTMDSESEEVFEADMLATIAKLNALAAEAVEAELIRLTEWYNKDGSAEKSKGGYYNSYVKRRIAKVAKVSKQ